MNTRKGCAGTESTIMVVNSSGEGKRGTLQAHEQKRLSPGCLTIPRSWK